MVEGASSLQVEDPVAQSFGPDLQVTAIGHRLCGGVRQAAHSKLDGGPIPDLAADQRSDLVRDVVRTIRHRRNRLVDFDQVVNVVEVNHCIPEREWHVRVGQRHHQTPGFQRGFHSGGQDIHLDSKADRSVLGHRRMDDHHIRASLSVQ